eukprot:Skav221135  [mRNA]  locus=scaffold233:656414:667251:- [translate_table: standard]
MWCEVLQLLQIRVLPHLQQTPKCIRACGWVLGLRLLTALQQQQQQPDVVMGNSAIGACGQVVAWSRAIAEVERTRSRGLRADLFTLNILMSTHERLADRSMPRAWRHPLDTLHNFEDLELEAEPGPRVLNAAGARWRWAVLGLDSEAGVDGHSLRSAIGVCAKGKRWEVAEALQLRSSGSRRHAGKGESQFKQSGIANGLLAAWASLGLWQRSLTGWRGSDLVGCNAALSAAERSQEWPCALQLVSDIEHRILKPTLVTHNTLIGALAGAGQWQMALFAAGIICSSVSQDVISFNMLLRALDAMTPWRTGLQRLRTLTSASRLSCRVISFSSCVSSCATSAQWQWALYLEQCLEGPARWLQNLRTSEVNAVSHSTAITACPTDQWPRSLALAQHSGSGGPSWAAAVTTPWRQALQIGEGDAVMLALSTAQAAAGADEEKTMRSERKEGKEGKEGTLRHLFLSLPFFCCLCFSRF